MQLSFLAQSLNADPTLEALRGLTELLAAYGVYALVVIFLFYAQRRTFKDFKDASTADRDRLWKVYKGTVWFTYILIAIAIPVWIATTFIYHPKTVLWGDVSNLRQMAGQPKRPGEVFVDQQVAPLQQDVKFYVDTKPDRNDPALVTFYWALVEDGQQSEVPLVFSHRYRELVPADSLTNSGVPLDPNQPTAPTVRDIMQKKKFVVKVSTLAALQGTSFEFRYNPAGEDPDHNIGAIRLLTNGNDQLVPLEDFKAELPAQGVRNTVLAWLRPSVVFAQAPAKQQVSATQAERLLPYLGSRDLKQQLIAEQVLTNVDTLPWNSVRAVLADPKATEDHTLLVHNLSMLLTSQHGKSLNVPPDIRLELAKNAYKVSDFKTSTPLFNSLSEGDLKGDITNYYYRGVSNMQTGNLDAASDDLIKYVNKAPNPGAKAVAQKTLFLTNQRAKAK